jgi:hypothetical protein
MQLEAGDAPMTCAVAGIIWIQIIVEYVPLC